MKKLLFRLRVSRIVPGEIGLFAEKNFKKDEIVSNSSNYDEVYKKWPYIKKLDNSLLSMVNDFCVGDDKGAYLLEDFNKISAPWYMNHSCDGNVGFDGGDNFIAIKNIKKGDELTWDYALAESNPRFKMKCLCGTKKCRGMVTGNDWKEIEDRKYMLSLLKNKI